MRQAVVLDSSALLALFQAEPGAEKVSGRIDGASISAVNWSEVLQVANDPLFPRKSGEHGASRLNSNPKYPTGLSPDPPTKG